MKRRQFTQFFALLGGSLALPVLARDHSVSPIGHDGFDDEPFSRRFFENRLGQRFHIAGEDTRTLVLKRTENACGKHCREQFHAIFEVRSGKPLNDGIFRLERDRADCFDLYLTGSGQGGGQQHVIATINRQAPV